MEIFTYTDRLFLTQALQTYLDRGKPDATDCEIIRRILREFLKNEQEIAFCEKERQIIKTAIDKYPSIGMCNKLILQAVDELTLKIGV